MSWYEHGDGSHVGNFSDTCKVNTLYKDSELSRELGNCQ